MSKSENKPAAKSKKAKAIAEDEYLSDLSKNGMLYGALVRSPRSSGRITNIDSSMLPEDYTLYTAREIPGSNTVKTFSTMTNVFCTDEVHYEGEPVGIIVGPDIKSTRRWAKKIQISFDFSLHTEGELTQEEKEVLTKTRTLLSSRTVKKGFYETEEASDEKNEETFFKDFPHDIKSSWTYREIPPYWIEPSGAFVSSEGESLAVYSPTQWTSHLKKCVADVLGISEKKIEIRKTQNQTKNMNGSWRSALLSCQVAVASYLSGKSVKLLLSREEQRIFMKNGLETHVAIRTASNKNGELVAIKARITANAGYQNPFASEIADRLTVAFINMYLAKHISVETNIISSPLPPTSISAEKLDAAPYFAIEGHMHLVAKKSGILPDEIKIMNMQNEDASFTFKGLKWKESINAITEKSDFARKYSSYNLNSAQNPEKDEPVFFSLARRGIGLSSGLDGALFLGSTFENYQQKMEITLGYDGNLTITAPAPSDSIESVWKNIASKLLEIDQSMIRIETNTEDEVQSPFPEGFSSNISIMTSLLRKCCLDIQKKRFKVPLPITAKKSTTSSIKKSFDAQKFSGSPFYATSFGCAIMEIELNPYTYKIKIKGIWVAIDCGEIFSMKAAENAVRLAIRQEMEDLVEDDTLLSESTNIFFVQSQNPPCQIGSLIHNLIPGAFAAALSQATDCTIPSIPCTDEEIFECSNNKDGKMENEKEKTAAEKEKNTEMQDEKSSAQKSENKSETENINETAETQISEDKK